MKRVVGVLSRKRLREVTWVSLAKGLKFKQGNILTMTDIIEREIGRGRILALSGPSHAEEVSKEVPTAVVLAAKKDDQSSYKKAEQLTGRISNDKFRVYTRKSSREVEMCGGVKNPIAIAAGIAEGLSKSGDNTFGTLLARGLNEITSFLGALGLRKEPAFGLAGVGDLAATCKSPHSRNRSYGLAIGKGKKMKPGTIDGMIVEGYYTVKNLKLVQDQLGIEMPICEQVYQVIYNDKNPELAVRELMTREHKEESLL